MVRRMRAGRFETISLVMGKGLSIISVLSVSPKPIGLCLNST